MAAIPIIIPFVLTAMFYPPPSGPREISVYSTGTPMKFACVGPKDTKILNAELLTMSSGTYTNKVKIFYHESDTDISYYLRVEPTTNTIATIQGSEQATVFLMRTDESVLSADGTFKLEYNSDTGADHEVMLVHERTEGASSNCDPYNLVVVPLEESGSGLSDESVQPDYTGDDLRQLTGVLRAAMCGSS